MLNQPLGKCKTISLHTYQLFQRKDAQNLYYPSISRFCSVRFYVALSYHIDFMLCYPSISSFCCVILPFRFYAVLSYHFNFMLCYPTISILCSVILSFPVYLVWHPTRYILHRKVREQQIKVCVIIPHNANMETLIV